jgi:hypothetical protein
LTKLLAKLPPGRHVKGMVLITKPDAFADQLSPWLLGNTIGRIAIGRTAFGDFLIFRDLRQRAMELGLDDPEAHDIALLDIHYKQMRVVGSVDDFLNSFEASWLHDMLHADLYSKAKKRIGDFSDDECYGFVPALAVGGSAEATSVQRQRWDVHQDILRQW